jgi:hypothetical protein
MANRKISALTSATTPLAGTETLPIVQGGATVKATVANITGAGLYPGSFTTLASTGNTTLGDASTDTVRVNGYMGVGGAASSINGHLNLGGNTLTGAATARGFRNSQIIGSGITSSFYSYVSIPSTEAAAFTLTQLLHYVVTSASLGAGSGITNQTGLYIPSLAGATNNYGVVSELSSGTNKWNIYASGTAQNYFAGNVGIGTSSPNASAILDAQSTTKGVRMPNMTTTQKNAIASPAAGLMVFDTTLAKLCVYSGIAWETITSI